MYCNDCYRPLLMSIKTFWWPTITFQWPKVTIKKHVCTDVEKEKNFLVVHFLVKELHMSFFHSQVDTRLSPGSHG